MHIPVHLQNTRGSGYRERADGLYLVIVYLCAKLTEEIGLAVIMSLVFSLSVYYGASAAGSMHRQALGTMQS